MQSSQTFFRSWHHLCLNYPNPLRRNFSRSTVLSAGRPSPSLSSPENDAAAARAWLEKFTSSKSIPRDEVKVTFARSSGPGGQNVNKVNTKATLRCSVDSAWLPAWLKEHLMRCPAYVASSRSLLITSTQHRSQAQNVEDCFTKLYKLIHTASLAAIPTPPDPAKLARKAAHERASKARNRMAKMYRSATKAGRKGD